MEEGAMAKELLPDAFWARIAPLFRRSRRSPRADVTYSGVDRAAAGKN
jgi:hypothetical protein